MIVDTENLVSLTEANQNFSRVVRVVDEKGIAVILKNNKPKYVVVNFDEYSTALEVISMRKSEIDKAADEIIKENMEALLELAKWHYLQQKK